MLTTDDLKLLQELFDKNNDRLRKEVQADIQLAIKPLATKKQLEPLATKEQLKSLATKEQLKSLATKEQLKSLATKEQLKSLATKEQLKSLATKEQLKSLATKEEILSLATKDDLDSLRSQFMHFEKQQTRRNRNFTKKLNLIIGYFDKEIVGLKKDIDLIKRLHA